jgi:hypothetical protein
VIPVKTDVAMLVTRWRNRVAGRPGDPLGGQWATVAHDGGRRIVVP